MWFGPLNAISIPSWHTTLFHSRPKGYKTPSWSWTSPDSPVIHVSKAHYKGISGVCPELKVLKCEMTPAPLNRVSGGTLILMEFIRPAIWDIGARSLTVPEGEGKVVSINTFQYAVSNIIV
jgi:hypothetical protein